MLQVLCLQGEIPEAQQLFQRALSVSQQASQEAKGCVEAEEDWETSKLVPLTNGSKHCIHRLGQAVRFCRLGKQLAAGATLAFKSRCQGSQAAKQTPICCKEQQAAAQSQEGC